MNSAALARLREMEARARWGGGAERVERQHARGKYTARERLDLLLDPGTFQELDAFGSQDGDELLGDSVVTGYGQIAGRPVYVFSQDFTVLGGSVGAIHGRKICKVMDLAMASGAPLIGLNDSGGARIQEGVDALAAYGEIFYRNTIASGVIPQISVILGPCAGGAVYSPAITDFVFMVHGTSHMFITGPEVIRAVTRKEVSFEGLGGAQIHSQASGVAHFACADEGTALAEVRRLLGFLPGNNADDPPRQQPTDRPDRLAAELEELVPEAPDQAYDMRQVLQAVLDDGEFMEVQAGFAPNLLVGFARLDGYPVGIVAQQPDVLAGVLDIDASDKGARFIRFCDCFNVPLVTLADTPGFLPGVEQEHGGIIRHGAKMIFAYAEATVPKVAVITRKAYGGAYIVMSSKHLRGDINLAWPGAEIAVMGPEAAVNVLHKKRLAAGDADALRGELIAEYRERFANPYTAAARGYLDAVIPPRETRPRLITALKVLRGKRSSLPMKKHSNIPL
ncbi:MAG: acyl-CoA carboxylase subunit beta [Anaerolineae bacterium]|nr:acyl-CoA carboxylase subunit beta [Anaerolineae bacterium]